MKSYDEIADEYANKRLIGARTKELMKNPLFKDVAERYAQQRVNEVVGNKWVSVKDELPEDYSSVIGCLKNKSVSYYNYSKSVGFFSLIVKDGWQEKNPVTHWMPLPEPPNQS